MQNEVNPRQSVCASPKSTGREWCTPDMRTSVKLGLLVIGIVSLGIQLLPLFSAGRVFVRTGYGAAGDVQRMFMVSTGHLYAGQWNSLVSPSENAMGWAPLGQTADLLESVMLAMLQIVTGSSFLNSFYFASLPVGLPLLFPLLVLGLYRQHARERDNPWLTLLVFAYTAFGSLFFIATVFNRMFGMSYFFYVSAIFLLALGYSTRSRSDFVLFAIVSVAVTLSYHTLATYLIIAFSATLVITSLLGKGYYRPRSWSLVGIALVTVVSAWMTYLVITTLVEPFYRGLFSFAEASRISTISNVIVGPFSLINATSELAAALIFVSALVMGSMAVFHHRANPGAKFLFLGTISLVFVGIGLLLGTGFLSSAGRTYQAIFPLVPFFLAMILAQYKGALRTVVVVAALISVIIVPIASTVYVNQEFGIYGNTLSGQAYAQVEFTGSNAVPAQPIFANFAVAESMLYFGRVNVFGLSSYAFNSSTLANYTATFYGNGSPVAIEQAIREITGSSSVVFLLQNDESRQVVLETVGITPSNPNFAATYLRSFDIVYSNGGTADYFIRS